jgi:hypothetical protein
MLPIIDKIAPPVIMPSFAVFAGAGYAIAYMA